MSYLLSSIISGYVQQLMDEVVALAEKCHMTFNEVPPLVQAPPPLCSSFERPNKEDAVKQLTSRYNKDQSLTFDK